LARQLQELHEQATTHRDERAEAELRAAVGEFSDAEASEVFNRCDTELASLEARRTTVGAELARMQGILAESRRRTPTPSSVPTIRATPIASPALPEPAPQSAAPVGVDVAAEHEREPDLSTRPEPVAAPAEAQAAAPGFDELAFLHSVVGPSDG